MSIQTFRVDALTPLLFRDGRPFSANAGESRATSLLLPPPSVVAGLMRTFVGDQLDWDWRDPGVVKKAMAVRLVRFHFERTMAGETLQVVPAPRTAVLHSAPVTPPSANSWPAVTGDPTSVMRLSPAQLRQGFGCDGPAGIVPLAVMRDVKPVPGYRLWLWPDVEGWLGGRTDIPRHVLEPPLDERVQIAIDPRRGAAQDGMLFTAQYRAWDGGDNAADNKHARWSLVACVDNAPDLPGTGTVAHFGAERRPVVLTREECAAMPQPGPALRSALTSTKRLTLQLLTPALFDGGWRPGWATEPARMHPALAGARIVAAAVGRPETVSGWSYEAGRRGPKATRWAVPAGSTYFLELARPLTEQQVTDLWLTSVSDQITDKNDAYGIAVWGVWS